MRFRRNKTRGDYDMEKLGKEEEKGYCVSRKH
jgi:hypothetical protein